MSENKEQESQETEAVNEEELEATESTQEENETTEEEPEEVEAAAEEAPAEKTPEEEYAELNDKYLRLYSDFDNFRRRTAKERLELMNTAAAGVFSSLLPVLDDFDRAKKAADDNPDDLESIKEGYGLIHEKFRRVLIDKGLEEMDSMGKEFDSDMYEAVTNIPAPSKKEKGMVMDVLEKGYSIGGKIIRFAKVVVGA